MNFDNLELVRAIDEQRHAQRKAPSRPLENRRRRHVMAKALRGFADRLDA